MSKFTVVYLGGKQAGLIGMLTTMAFGCQIKAVVPRGNEVDMLARKLKLLVFDSVYKEELWQGLGKVDLLVSVHSGEIIPKELLDIPRLGGINVHPCLYLYKGAFPIRRFITDGVSLASVGVHRMTSKVDCGEVLLEQFLQIDRRSINTVTEVYNMLYPLYSMVLLGALELLAKSDGENGCG